MLGVLGMYQKWAYLLYHYHCDWESNMVLYAISVFALCLKGWHNIHVHDTILNLNLEKKTFKWLTILQFFCKSSYLETQHDDDIR